MIEKIIKDYSINEQELIINSYKIALESLKDVTRGNGHPFIEHPIGVAKIVATELGLMPEAIAAVFLHEASRYNKELIPQITKTFPQEVINIVEGLNNISAITPKQTKLQAENYRKLIISYSKDPRVTLIKLADRLEIMRNLEIFPKSSIMRKVTETVMLYIPLAHQLGLYNLKSELEDLYFKHSDPENFRTITNKLKASEGDRQKLVTQFINPLKQKLEQAGIKYKLKARTKTAYSIWKKMQKQGVSFEEVFDVFAIRFILDVPLEKEHDYCWEVYSLVTEEYKPDTTRLRDWITNPKPNGYESLHTTVENKEGTCIEVQIRTQRMDDMAENGHASHWSYKGVKSVEGLDEWLTSVKGMLESTDPNPYKGSENLSLNEIFVFTPMGDLKQLPKGATVLDFAFSIHTNLGVKCNGAKVNGKIYSIRDTLKTGDVIEIMSNKNQKPSADWINIVITSKAKSRIKAKLKEEEGKTVAAGREILERRMKNWKIELNDDILSDITKAFKFKSIGELCTAISKQDIDLAEIKSLIQTKDTNSQELIDSAKDNIEPNSKTVLNKPKKATEQSNSHESDYLILSDKLNQISVKMAKCCNPIFGDDVFGFISAAGGTKIHRISCPNAARLLENYPYRVQKVKWQQVSSTARFQCGLKIIADSDLQIGPTIMDICTKQNASIRSYSIKERNGGGKVEVIVEINISVSNNSHLDLVISAIKKLRGVKNVLRTRI